MEKYKHIKKIMIIFIIISFLTVNIPVISEKIFQNSEIEKQNVIIKIGSDIYGNKAKYINISYLQTQRLIEKLTILKQKLNENQINDLTYFKNFIKIFQEEDILPFEYNLDFLLEIYDLLYQNISNLESFDLKFEKSNRNKNFNTSDIPIHFGRRTIIASLGIGNFLVRRIIPIRPYDFINVIDKEILRKYNLTSTFSYAAACMWTPGPSGYHVLHSFIPIAGFEDFSHKIFSDKSIGGVFLFGVNISLEAFSKDRSIVFFDATIGVYGADFMIGF